VLSGIVITLLAAIWLRFRLRSGGLRVRDLWLNGALYAAYLAIALA
jgi:cation:H+ antiporter